MRTRKEFWTGNWGVLALLSIFLALPITGCCTTYPGAAYVEADEDTYNYAQPKLEAWAEAEGGDWPAIVKNKGISWKARNTRAKEHGKKAHAEEETPSE